MSYSGQRVESRTAAVQTATTGTKDKTITTLRDALGRTVEVDTSEHETFYTHDPNGKMVSASREISPGTFQTRTYGFDARGNLLSASLPELGGVAISYKPDAIGLSWQTVDGEHDLTWSYDGNARPVSLENTTGALL